MLGIFLDIETTGLNAAVHKPIDIACKVVDLNQGILVGKYQSIISQSWTAWMNRDPGSIHVNGFTWNEVLQGKDTDSVAREIISLFGAMRIQRGEAVFICQNPSFDRGFFNQIIGVYEQEQLNWPYHWLDLASMYWAVRPSQAPIHKASLSKNEIARVYGLPPEAAPHRASNGVDHLILCYQSVLGVKFQ